MKSKFIQTFNKLGVNIYLTEISTCHPLKKDGHHIVRFNVRDTAEEVLGKKKELEGLDSSDIWGPSAKLRVFPNLSPAYLRARFLAKKLRDMGAVHHFGSNSNGVWVFKEDGSPKIFVDCDEDIVKLLPEGILLSDLLQKK